jgi:hypothetical protein
MQFLALASDLTVATETRDKYKFVAELKCPICSDVFHLWAPFLETEESEVVAQSGWLYNYLKKKCPEHADVLFTPDRPR